MRRKFS